jgi:acetyl-CoA carboxylase biotin carboxyl carrier protein
MTIKEIKEILDLFNSTDVAELEVQRGENRVRLKRAATEVTHLVPSAPARSITATLVPAPAPVAEENTTLVRSPIVGTYYDAPSPDAAPFVKVGDIVEAGQVLCIIESMKLMNEIEAEAAGTVVAKLLESGRPVEYGEALFSVKPRP